MELSASNTLIFCFMDIHNASSLKQKLNDLGLMDGDTVYLSGYNPFGLDPKQAIQAILNAIGEHGTICFPDFHYQAREKLPLLKTLLDIAGAVSSGHPLFAIAAVGRKAAEITGRHSLRDPFSTGTPVAKIVSVDAKIICFKRDPAIDLFITHAETILRLPYCQRYTTTTIAEPSGQESIQIKAPACTNNSWAIADELGIENPEAEGLMLISAKKLMCSTLELLRRNPAALLCNKPNCGICAESRALLDAIRDWIRESQHSPIILDDEKRTIAFLGDRDAPIRGRVFKRKVISLEELTQEGMRNVESHKN